MTTSKRQSPPAASTLFRRMRRDHARVLEGIDALEATLRRGRRALGTATQERALAELLELLGEEFSSHMAAEDEALYPALLAAIPASAGSIEPLFAEHAELKQMLRRLQAVAGEPPSVERSEQIRVQVHDIADLLRLHIRKEESLVFRLAPRLLAPREIAAVALLLDRRSPPPPPRRPETRPKGVTR